MTIALIGESRFEEFELLTEAIEDRGHEVVMWEMTDWPSDIPVTLDVGSDTFTVDREYHLDEITGVFPWVHHIFHPSLSRFAEDFETDGTRNLFMKTDQWRGVFRSLLGRLDDHGATVFYPPDSQHYDDWKPLQLEQFTKEAISIPDTVFTTDPDRLREFVAEHGEVVYKPVVNEAWPNKLTEEDIEEAPLERLASAPVQFQEYVEGDDVRAFFLDGEIVGTSRYVTDDWTFKTETAEENAESIELREEVREEVECAARIAPIRFGAVDLRVTDESHVLLEVNPGPRFALHDISGATDVSGILADALVN